LSGVEKLTQSIIDEAEGEARAVFDHAKVHIEQGKQKMLHVIEKRKQDILAHAKKTGEEQKKRALAVYGLELRKDLLKAKRDALDTAYDKALEELLNLPKEQYLAHIKKLILTNISTGKETVLTSENEKYIDKAFLDGVNSALNGSGKAGMLSLAKTSEVKSGFILQEGGLVVDCSFEMVVKALRETTETQAANILFG